MRTYASAYRMLVSVCMEQQIKVFRIGEEEICLVMIKLARIGKSEAQMRQVLAILSLLEG